MIALVSNLITWAVMAVSTDRKIEVAVRAARLDERSASDARMAAIGPVAVRAAENAVAVAKDAVASTRAAAVATKDAAAAVKQVTKETGR